jgi:hypothetical protein
MRLSFSLITALALSGSGSAAAFKMPTFGRSSTSVTSVGSPKNMAVQRFMSSEDKAVCDMPDVDVDTTDFMSQKGSGRILRSAMLTNAAGELVSLGDSMGGTTGSSLVIFLRHLG